MRAIIGEGRKRHPRWAGSNPHPPPLSRAAGEGEFRGREGRPSAGQERRRTEIPGEGQLAAARGLAVITIRSLPVAVPILCANQQG